jgi:hypothetical protein
MLDVVFGKDPEDFPQDSHGLGRTRRPVIDPGHDGGVIGSNSDVVVAPPGGPQN